MAYLQAFYCIDAAIAVLGCSIGCRHLYKERANLGKWNLSAMMALILSLMIFVTIAEPFYQAFLTPYRAAYLVNTSISIATFVLVGCHMMTPIKYFVSIYPCWTSKVVYTCQFMFALVEFVLYVIDFIVYLISPYSFIHSLLFIVIKSTIAVTCLAVLFTLTYISSKFAFQAIFKDTIRTQVLNQLGICLKLLKILITMFLSAMSVLLWASLIDTTAKEINSALKGLASVLGKSLLLICFVIYEQVYNEIKILVAIGIEAERKRLKLGLKKSNPGSVANMLDLIGTRSKTSRKVDATISASDGLNSPPIFKGLSIGPAVRKLLSFSSPALNRIYSPTQITTKTSTKIMRRETMPEISLITGKQNTDDYVPTVILLREPLKVVEMKDSERP